MNPLLFFRRFFFSGRRYADIGLVVCGLGNPGEKYKDTRHNAGFLVADELIAGLRDAVRFTDCGAEVAVGALASGVRIAVVKPQTFMNRSGTAVACVRKKSRVPMEKMVVVVDDFHLPAGSLRIRREGSDGGHNGLKSIGAAMGNGYPRIRIGIGPRPSAVTIIDFVLGSYTSSERARLAPVIGQAVRAVEMITDAGLDAAMNAFNRT